MTEKIDKQIHEITENTETKINECNASSEYKVNCAINTTENNNHKISEVEKIVVNLNLKQYKI